MTVLSATGADIYEGLTNARFNLSLDAPATAPVTLSWYVQGGSAMHDEDYYSAKGQVTFAIGQQNKEIAVHIFGDSLIEGDETFYVVLNSLQGATFAGGAAALMLTGTILDNDSGGPPRPDAVGAAGTPIAGPDSASETLPTLSIRDAAYIESGSGGSFSGGFLLTLDRAPTAPVTVRYAFLDGTAVYRSDYASGFDDTVTFAPGQMSAYIPIEIKADAVAEGDETFQVVLTNLTGAVFDGGAAALAATGVILDNDGGAPTGPGGLGAPAERIGAPASEDPGRPVLTAYDVGHVEGPLGDTTYARFLLTLDRAPTAPVTVSFRTVDGTASAARGDYAETAGQVTFAAGQRSVFANVPVYGDSASEGAETFSLIVHTKDAALAGDAPALIATGTILDDEGGGPQEPGDIGGPAAQIPAAASASDTLPTINVHGAAIIEGDSGEPRSAVFLVTLDEAPTQTVDVAYFTQDGTASSGGDYRGAAGNVRFVAGQRSAVASVQINPDATAEADETFSLILTNARGAVFADHAGAMIAAATIVNDDGAAPAMGGGLGPSGAPIAAPASASATLPTITIHDGAFIEGESDLPARFLVMLDKPATAPVVFDYILQDGAAAPGRDYAIPSGSSRPGAGRLTIEAGAQGGYITVPIRGDAAAEGSETFTLVALNAKGGVFAGGAGALVATATIIDNDSGPLPAAGGLGGEAKDFGGPLPVSDALPTLSVHDVSAFEGDSGNSYLHFVVTLDRPATAPVTFNYLAQDGFASSGANDYFSLSGLGGIAAGQQSAWIDIAVKGDTAPEANETVFLILSGLSGATFLHNVPAMIAKGVIINDDGGAAPALTGGTGAPTLLVAGPAEAGGPPVLRIVSTSANEGSPAGIYFLLSHASSAPVTFRAAFAEGSAESAGFSGLDDLLITIPAGATSGAVAGTIAADALSQADRNYSFVFSEISGAVFEGGGETATASVLIRDDDGGGTAGAVSSGPFFFTFGRATEGADTLYGSSIADAVQALGGNDIVYGGAGADVLFGMGGDDILIGGAGADELNGGAGVDEARFETFSAFYTLDGAANTATGQAGYDTATGIERFMFLDGALYTDTGNFAAQVFRLYDATLARAPDSAGLAGWVRALEAGGTTLLAAAAGFVNSAEFQTVYGPNISNTAFVTLLYNNVLGRDPDPGGLNGWLGYLGAGHTRAEVVIGFSESAENILRTEGDIGAGLWVQDLDVSFLARMYDTVFNRGPDAGGLEYWKGAYESGQFSQLQVAANFITAPEFQNTYGALNNTQFIQQLYLNVLGRPGEQAGVDGWLGFLGAGGTREQIVLGFSESAEHIALSAAQIDYGIWLV